MNKQTIQRTLTGVVVGTKMAKTLVVRVERTLVHPKYGKRYVRSKKFHVHDEQGGHVLGDRVTFCACRPVSKTKRWRLIAQKK
ncbi:MAG: 30S ribosomal protein S17 [Patescibacteria group bacterium]